MRSTGNPVVVARDLGSCAHYLPHAPLVRRPVTGHPTNLRFAPGDARDTILQLKRCASNAYPPKCAARESLICTTANCAELSRAEAVRQKGTDKQEGTGGQRNGMDTVCMHK